MQAAGLPNSEGAAGSFVRRSWYEKLLPCAIRRLGDARRVLCLRRRRGSGAQSESAEEPTYSEDSGREFDPGKIIVKLEEDATPRDLRELNRENNARTEEDLPRSDVNVIDLPSDTTVQEGIEAYEDSPDVEYAEPDFLLGPTATPNDPFYKD